MLNFRWGCLPEKPTRSYKYPKSKMPLKHLTYWTSQLSLNLLRTLTLASSWGKSSHMMNILWNPGCLPWRWQGWLGAVAGCLWAESGESILLHTPRHKSAHWVHAAFTPSQREKVNHHESETICIQIKSRASPPPPYSPRLLYFAPLQNKHPIGYMHHTYFMSYYTFLFPTMSAPWRQGLVCVLFTTPST